MREQAGSKILFRYRAGRITASKYRGAVHTKHLYLSSHLSEDSHTNLSVSESRLIIAWSKELLQMGV